MKRHLLMSLLCISLMTLLASCAKEIHGIKLQWVGIPVAIILIVIIGVIIFKNYKSIAEEKKLIAEMAIRQKIFAEEEAERQKQIAAKKEEINS
jgi:hypothetical protein